MPDVEAPSAACSGRRSSRSDGMISKGLLLMSAARVSHHHQDGRRSSWGTLQRDPVSTCRSDSAPEDVFDSGAADVEGSASGAGGSISGSAVKLVAIQLLLSFVGVSWMVVAQLVVLRVCVAEDAAGEC
eukprot:7186788-Prymnesium_polylepis.1